MRVYIEAYDNDNCQILGTLDGQGVIAASNYKRTKHYKALPNFRTLNNRVKYYNLTSITGSVIETIQNNTHI